jgi:hypothetical protein
MAGKRHGVKAGEDGRDGKVERRGREIIDVSSLKHRSAEEPNARRVIAVWWLSTRGKLAFNGAFGVNIILF